MLLHRPANPLGLGHHERSACKLPFKPIFGKVTDIGRPTVALSDLTNTRFVSHSNSWASTDLGEPVFARLVHTMDRIHNTPLRQLLWHRGANERRGLSVGNRAGIFFLLADGISDNCTLKLSRHGNSAL